jgi:hypothetical protein
MSFLWIQVIMIIVLQGIATVLLWLLSPTTQIQTDTFALFLSADIIGFVILSYQYRSRRYGRIPSQGWVSLGYLALVILLSSNLIFH